MDLTSLFSDDQMALIGCVLALSVCGLIATLSYRFGPAGKKPAGQNIRTLPVTPARHAEPAIQDRRAA